MTRREQGTPPNHVAIYIYICICHRVTHTYIYIIIYILYTDILIYTCGMMRWLNIKKCWALYIDILPWLIVGEKRDLAGFNHQNIGCMSILDEQLVFHISVSHLGVWYRFDATIMQQIGYCWLANSSSHIFTWFFSSCFENHWITESCRSLPTHMSQLQLLASWGRPGLWLIRITRKRAHQLTE